MRTAHVITKLTTIVKMSFNCDRCLYAVLGHMVLS